MRRQTVYLQSAFVLQSRAYRETSLLIDVFTRDHGVLPMLAKGVRGQKKGFGGLLQPFSALLISFVDKSQIKLITDVELQQCYPLERMALYCGFYVNELIQRFLAQSDPAEEVFDLYQRCLNQLSQIPEVEQTLRYFELDLLQVLGFGLDLSDLNSSSDFRFDRECGLVAADDGVISAQTLQAMEHRLPLNAEQLGQAKRLLRTVIDSQLTGKPLQSRKVLADMIHYL